MVRAQGKQTPEEKKDSKKKSATAAANNVKKKPDTGSWPCKMDGCKKVFAREADLKRHQRTTKTHSIPGFQCPQCDATFTRTDALRRHQKSRHNGVVIEPIEHENDKQSGEDASSGSRSPSPAESPTRSQGEGSAKGSPSAGQSSSAGGSSGRASNYYRPHTMQDGYYAGYPPRPPPPGLMMDPHYPPPPMGLPTSATRGSWQPTAVPPPWPGPDGQPLPPPGMYIPASYYPSPYYRHPGMPPHMPQINPELLAQSNGHSNGIGPPESSLRNTSADTPKERSASASPSAGRGDDASTADPSQSMQAEGGADEGPDASTLMALQAVLAFQKEQEAREAEARAASARTGKASMPPSPAETSQAVLVEGPPDGGPSVVPTAQIDPDLDAVGEPDSEDIVAPTDDLAKRGKSAEEFVSEHGTPMLNPAELLTQESLASPPPEP
ncbi:hypothetical protein LXA43DRAFT_1188104 [Ganoderma leucocontextum]|nr:hypothetical protein LXA43DRAFT_1188104 [Ganoderma leucocontextum]